MLEDVEGLRLLPRTLSLVVKAAPPVLGAHYSPAPVGIPRISHGDIRDEFLPGDPPPAG